MEEDTDIFASVDDSLEEGNRSDAAPLLARSHASLPTADQSTASRTLGTLPTSSSEEEEDGSLMAPGQRRSPESPAALGEDESPSSRPAGHDGQAWATPANYPTQIPESPPTAEDAESNLIDNSNSPVLRSRRLPSEVFDLSVIESSVAPAERVTIDDSANSNANSYHDLNSENPSNGGSSEQANIINPSDTASIEAPPPRPDDGQVRDRSEEAGEVPAVAEGDNENEHQEPAEDDLQHNREGANVAPVGSSTTEGTPAHQEVSGVRGEVSPYFPSTTGTEASALQNLAHLNDSAADFQGTVSPAAALPPPKQKKKAQKGKKRKAVESVDSDADEGSCCTICFEPWSNSGEHRISSLKCGHFFGFDCIDKWLKGSGSACPNCNVKNTRKDIRVHYVSRLKAIDTSEKDRALADLEKARKDLRGAEFRGAELEVRVTVQMEEIERLNQQLKQFKKFRGELPASLMPSQPSASFAAIDTTNNYRLVYQRRFELIKGSSGDKTCRVLAYSDYLGMLVISQPSFTALAPGYGVRQFNVLDQKVGNFISLCKDQVRDLAFSRASPHLMLSCGLDNNIKITNMSNGMKVYDYTSENQVWACDWSAGNDYHFYLGTRRGSVLVMDIRNPDQQPTELKFPNGDTKPIIGLRSVPAEPAQGFTRPGFLVMNLTSLWYWSDDGNDNWSYYRLNIDQQLLWSLDFDESSRLVLVGCKPRPTAAHIVLELATCQLENGGQAVTARPLMTARGGSFNSRSFLRSSLLPPLPTYNGQVLVAFTKGTGFTDHKVVIQEVGSERICQELKVDRPVIDIKQIAVNNDQYLALLGETELIMYKWVRNVQL